jgi:protein-tyrosine-phosphatase
MNEDRMDIYDHEKNLILTAIALRDGGSGEFDEFYTCTGADLLKAEAKLRSKASQQPHAQSKSYPIVHNSEEHVKHLTPEQLGRAKEAWDLCRRLGHPGFDKIAIDLDNGAHPGCHLTSHDVRNAVARYGPCPACLEGKMNNPKAVTSTSPPAMEVGEHLHADLIQMKTVCIGGHTQMLTAVDEASGHVSGVGQPTKSKGDLCDAFDTIIAFYRQHGHRIRKITTDNENVLKACKTHLGLQGIELTHTPAGLHERRVERYIQTLKKRKAAILASLEFILPDELEFEAFQAAIQSINNSSCKVSAPYTPHHLVCGRKPFIPEHSFGEIGVFKGVSKSQRPSGESSWVTVIPPTV